MEGEDVREGSVWMYSSGQKKLCRGSGWGQCCPTGSRARQCAAGSPPVAGTRGLASHYVALWAPAAWGGCVEECEGRMCECEGRMCGRACEGRMCGGV